IMTSNMGSNIIQEKLANIDNINSEYVIEETKNEVVDLLKKSMRPEFLNRIDEIIMFRPLTQKQIKDVVRIQMNNVAKTLEANDILITTTDEAINELARIGYDPAMGARPVKRVIQRQILNELSREILEEKIKATDNIVVDVFDGKFVFYNAK
ncbi:MAG: AAA family ATPase, partial [Bacteroidales bacterium]|nr:AAA family ATPase [Bacteroidales bacterium]